MITLAKYLKAQPSLARAAKFSLIYAGWMVSFRILALTLVTYVSIATDRAARFEDISELFGSNELPWIGLASLLFILLMNWLNPLNPDSALPRFNIDRLKNDQLPGFLQGVFLSLGVIGAFLISGIYRYIGDFTHYDDTPFLALSGIFIRVTSVMILAFSEEFIFRERIQKYFGNDEKWVGLFFTSGAYIVVKLLQFELGWMQSFTLLLVSFAFSLKVRLGGDWTRNAGFWAGVLVALHPLFSLPIFGNDFTGLTMIKLDPEIMNSGSPQFFLRLLTGGAGGPLSSFAFQLVVFLDIMQSIRKLRDHTRIKPYT